LNARSVNSAAGVVQAAMEQGRRTATGIALALESAQLLMSPENAAELERLASQVVELQNAMSEHRNDAARARRERDLMRERVSEPNGCAHCGAAKRSHGRRYISGVGGHAWERPSDEQVKARMLARRVARSPLPATPELDQVLEDLTGANLARWEEEQDTARLRLALSSAKRGRSQLRARVAELEAQRDRRRVRLVSLQNDALNMRGTLSPNGEDNKVPFTLGETLAPAVEWLVNRVAELLAERRTTNEALDDAVQALRADRAEPAKGPSAAESADPLTALFAPTQVLREESYAEAATPRVQAMRALLDGQHAAVEDPHDGPLAHSYRVSRDLPEMGGAR
jgi:hypothetical protein